MVRLRNVLRKKITKRTLFLASLGTACAVLLISFFFSSPNATFAWIVSHSEPKTSAPEQITKTVIFIPGLDLLPKDYDTIINNLKKNGYTVIEYTPTYEDPTEYKELIDRWTADIKKLVGEKQVIVLGHSVGGAVAAHFCSKDHHCVAGINMDGEPAYDEKIPVPFLYLQAGTGNYCDEECTKGRKLMMDITTSSEGVIVQIPDIKHFNFTDKREADLRTQDFLGTIDGRDIINNEIMKFLKSPSPVTR